ncbi:enoyl-CoA hydratase/isomerase family protein [Aeromicrobium sp. CF4.19]|uniref:enoyl-CoA hydratase/isomerase family protein n=1 Tax=Aeromicrobium sp. CF4.19 TaxID=3373082 RepID=UPI003EE7274C
MSPRPSTGQEPVVLTVTESGVARIELNRPEAANGLTVPMGEALEQALLRVRDDDAVRVVLLTGRGARFSAGGDLAAMADADDRGTFVSGLADLAHRSVRLMWDLDKPVVTGVQGAAAGAGLSLVLASDLVVAGRSAAFVTAYTAVGLTPDLGQSWLLPRVVGLQRALDLTLTSRKVTAQEAADWGIVSRLVDDADVESEAVTLAEKLAAGPAGAFGRARRLLRDGLTASLDEQLDAEAASIGASAATAETGALIDGFLRR